MSASWPATDKNRKSRRTSTDTGSTKPFPVEPSNLVEGYLPPYVAQGSILAHEIRPDAILLDMKMPMMDGVEASTRFEEADETRKIPIIALTAPGLEGDDEKVRKTCDAHLMKPIRWSEENRRWRGSRPMNPHATGSWTRKRSGSRLRPSVCRKSWRRCGGNWPKSRSRTARCGNALTPC